ncbi:histidine phosphatase family protein [Paenibacillus harenae]|uniref:Broad specificity phosphatase PhoE/8-oxo-dGTP pyrophosphatase MutT (NUDIX family) n=1 Tax=Paenibacillus harenae TaxID=306543 RepID=A0ABT9TV72_PAEHA|nr:histidine phosphatase family protein [Paenibacillus harenae]MDQ0111243.1 broad specificity phosphatase PhoE/8-oxo-dGTP pyrophosphatase MutT (NUDIX family) [Paenibacillus harenae]
MKTKLFLTRHGETEWNVEGKMQGLKDSPLTKLGKRQARWLKSSLKNIKFDAIYSSPSPRTYQTAEIIREERENEIIICESLKEISLGSWEGHKKSDIENLFPDEYNAFWYTAHLYKPSNDGESFSQLQDRIIPTVLDIINRHKGGNVLIVTHAIALKVIMAYFRGDSLENLWNPPIIQPTSLNKVVITDTEYNIEMYGDTSHYQTVRKAVGAIVFQRNEFLLVHKLLNTFDKESGVWDFPKGGVEEEDLSLKDAIMRELFEETGTDKYIIKQELPEKITFYFEDDIKKKIGFECQETTMFLVEFVGNKNDLKPCGEEIDEILLVDLEKLLEKLSHKETTAYVQNHCQFLLNRGTDTRAQ